MTEPTTAATTLSVTTLTVTGAILGMQYSLLLLGLLGVLLSLGIQERKNRLAAFSLVAISTLFSGALSPVAAAVVAKYFDLQANVDEIRVGAAVLIGYGWQSIAPGLWSLIKQKLGGGSQL